MPGRLWTYSYRLILSGLMAVTCLSFRQAEAAPSCRSAHRSSPQAVEIRDVKSFGEAMSKGMLLNPEQPDLFEVYRSLFLGNPLISVNGRNLNSVTEILKRYPELQKMTFREHEISAVEKVYASTAALQSYIKSLMQTGGQVRNNLLRIEANLEFWKKTLDYPELPVPRALKNPPTKDTPEAEKAAYRKVRNDFRQKEQEYQKRFTKYLNRIISKTNRDLLANLKDETTNHQNKVKILYKTLQHLQEWMDKNKRNTQVIRQAMVDLVHTVGIGNASTQEMLKSKSGLEQIEGLRLLLAERDTVAFELGYQGHFQEILARLRVDYPTGLTKNENPYTQLNNLEKTVLAGNFSTRATTTTRVRSLSIQESAFRSCLGGDCSTNTYFEKALDPNYIYFTMTDSEHHSSGHLTLVLGSATNPTTGNAEKVAFADKLQNVPNQVIPSFLHAISKSLAEKGYKLAIPEVLELPAEASGHGGLSNTASTMQFVQDYVLSKLTKKLTEFTPHAHQYQFANRYSRADKRLNVRIFEPTPVTDGAEIRPGHEYKNFLASKDLNTTQLVQEFLKLRDSEDPKDILKFISSGSIVDNLEKIGLYSKASFSKDIEAVIARRDLPFAIRKQAAFEANLSTLDYGSLQGSLTQNFTAVEIAQIQSEIRQWPQSSDQRKKKFAEKSVEQFLDQPLKKILNELPTFLFSKSAVNAENKEGQTLLHRAIFEREKNTVENLLQTPGVDINSKNKQGSAPIHLAVQAEHEGIVKALLQNSGIEINAKNRDGYTPLHMAVFAGNEGIFKALIQFHGVNFNAKDHQGQTALHLAIIDSNKNVIRTFLETPGIDVNEKNNKGDTPLLEAVDLGQPGNVELLLMHPDVDVTLKNQNGYTPIALAAYKGDQERRSDSSMMADPRNKWASPRYREIVLLLLQHPKMNLEMGYADFSSSYGPKHWQHIQYDTLLDLLFTVPDFRLNDRMMSGLVEYVMSGSDPRISRIKTMERILKLPNFNLGSITFSKGSNPLLLAYLHGNMELLKLFLKHPTVKVNVKDENGFPFLIGLLKRHHRYAEITELVIRRTDVDVNAKGKDGRTALIEAAKENNEMAVKLLLEHAELDVNAKDKDGMTAFLWAANRPKIAKLLLRHPNVDVNLADRFGFSPLMRSISFFEERNEKEIMELVETLITHPDIKVNLTDRNDFSALMYATSHGQKEMVEILLKIPNINVNLKDSDGKTALALAIDRHELEIADLLRAHGAVQ